MVCPLCTWNYQIVNAASTGNYWNKLESIIVSHVADEASIFVPKWIKTNADFDTFVHDFMPIATASAAIETQYSVSAYPKVRKRAAAVIADSSFTCNARQLFEAYSKTIADSVYMMD